MDRNNVRNLISRTIDGVDTFVNTESGEIFIDVPAYSPRYIHVEEGDTIQEGDVRTQTELELESPSLRKWTIEGIGEKTVVGSDQDTGERREWKRESLEKQLAIGEFSTELKEFERVSVTGGAEASDHEGRSNGESISVVLYGNDGRKFTQQYALIDDGAGSGERYVELVESDKRTETFDTDLRDRFDQAIERALRYEGYTV